MLGGPNGQEKDADGLETGHVISSIEFATALAGARGTRACAHLVGRSLTLLQSPNSSSEENPIASQWFLQELLLRFLCKY
jgi:hypothetical protein